MKEGAKSSELIIFPDGTLYHIDLKRAYNIPKNLFMVGAAGRVNRIAKYFDQIDFEFTIIPKTVSKLESIGFKHSNEERPEFYIKSGSYKGIPMAAMSIGIGPANTEIALNELHALFEYDHENDKWTGPADVNIIRVGTSGTALPEVPNGTLAVSWFGLGLDNLGAFYPRVRKNSSIIEDMEKRFLKETRLGRINPLAYISQADHGVALELESVAGRNGAFSTTFSGITIASPGFFAPEGRSIGRIKAALNKKEFIEDVQSFKYYDNWEIVNFEMESGILFRIGYEQLGYKVGTICLVMDNMAKDEVIDAKFAGERMSKCIEVALEAMLNLAKKSPK